MHHVLNALILLRCAIAFYTFIAAVAVLRLAFLLLPKDHPGRRYAEGRTGVGIPRIREALSERAAACYITHRHHFRR